MWTYDREFPNDRATTAVLSDDPGALTLHLLAGVWTTGQRHVGFVAAHVPAVLVGDRDRATRWVTILLERGLWHDDYGAACGVCDTRYANLPRGTLGLGYVVHDLGRFTSPVRKRPARRSTAQAEAGTLPGLDTPTDPAPPTPAQRAKAITDAYYEEVKGLCRWPAVNRIVRRTIDVDQWSDGDVRDAVLRLAKAGRPVTFDTLRQQLTGGRRTASLPTGQELADSWGGGQ